jgi:hypothetical protein
VFASIALLRISNKAIRSAGIDRAAQESCQASQQRGRALTRTRKSAAGLVLEAPDTMLTLRGSLGWAHDRDVHELIKHRPRVGAMRGTEPESLCRSDKFYPASCGRRLPSGRTRRQSNPSNKACNHTATSLIRGQLCTLLSCSARGDQRSAYRYSRGCANSGRVLPVSNESCGQRTAVADKRIRNIWGQASCSSPILADKSVRQRKP